MEIISESIPRSQLLYNGIQFHSKHAPEREAERYLAAQQLPRKGVCVLLAPGLPFVRQALARERPDLRCISLQPACFRPFLEAFYGRSGIDRQEWLEDGSQSLESFLLEHLDEDSVASLELLVWPAAQRAVPEFCERIGRRFSEHLRLLVANQVTTRHFGQRWMQNVFDNLGNLGRLQSLPHSKGCLVLAGSGPGLEDVLPLMRKHRERIVLWALPSALRQLGAWRLLPDLVVSSDAGYWADRHLDYLQFDPEQQKPVVVAPLRAMLRKLWRQGELPIVPCLMHFPWETRLFAAIQAKDQAAAGVPLLNDRGSVAFTALDLISLCHEGQVITCGLDFAWNDLISHARPHTFEENLLPRENRLAGRMSLLYHDRERSPSEPTPHHPWRQAGPLGIYRQWLNENPPLKQNRLADYNPSRVQKPLPDLDLDAIEAELDAIQESPVIRGGQALATVSRSRRLAALAGQAERILEELEKDAIGEHEEALRMLVPQAWQSRRQGQISDSDLTAALRSVFITMLRKAGIQGAQRA